MKAMTAQDQTAIIDFLAAPSTHGLGKVERIDTHTSIVFLVGARAYKLKRAVQVRLSRLFNARTPPHAL